MAEPLDLQNEAQEALERLWFIQSVEISERTDITVALRLHIRQGLFVHVFYGERSGSLYFALIEEQRRIFGIDKEQKRWHIHPFSTPDQHVPLTEGLEPRPLLTFLARVEELLLLHNLI